MVLEQIKELSPRTYEDANDLVHFVDSLVGKDDPSFENLEAALRSFMLVKHAKSKLNPASTYLSNLLSDIELLVGANAIVAQAEIVHAKGNLDAARPVLDWMKNSQEALEEASEAVEEQGAGSASMPSSGAQSCQSISNLAPRRSAKYTTFRRTTMWRKCILSRTQLPTASSSSQRTSAPISAIWTTSWTMRRGPGRFSSFISATRDLLISPS